jgi:hypothetical protein
MQEEKQEAELLLQVFQYSDGCYVIGLVDFDQLNSSDFAFTINHVLSLIYDESIDNYRLFEDHIINSSMVFNLSKHKVISMFSPSESLADEYFSLAQQISDRDNFVEGEDDQNLNEYYQVGQIQ